MQDTTRPGKKSISSYVWGMIVSGSITLLAVAGGFLGTIFGMLSSFRELSTAETANPEELAGGITLAISTTAIGLIIGALAGIAFIVYFVLWLIQACNNHPANPPAANPQNNKNA